MAFTKLQQYPGQSVKNLTLINQNQFVVVEDDYIFIYQRNNATEGEWTWIKNETLISFTPETTCLSQCSNYIYATKRNKLFQVNIQTLESRIIQLPFKTVGSAMIELNNTLHIIGGMENVHSKINIDYNGNNNDRISSNYHSDFGISTKRRGGQLFYNITTDLIYYIGGRHTFNRDHFYRDVIGYDIQTERWEFYPSEIEIPEMNNYKLNSLMVYGNILIFVDNNIYKYSRVNGWKIAQNILPEKGKWKSVFMEAKCNAIRLVQGYERRCIDFDIPLVLSYECKRYLSASNGQYVICNDIFVINCNTKNMYSIDNA
eukprot:37139_1